MCWQKLKAKKAKQAAVQLMGVPWALSNQCHELQFGIEIMSECEP